MRIRCVVLRTGLIMKVRGRISETFSLTLSVLVLIVLVGGCTREPLASPSGDRPKDVKVREILWTGSHDFGITPVKSERVHTFRVENQTTQRWRILDTRTSCGCTVARLDRDQAEPGDALEITVKYNSPSKSRDDRQKITLLLDDGNGLVLEVLARVRTAIAFARSRYDLSVAPGETRMVPLIVENYGTMDWTGISAVVMSSPANSWLKLERPELTLAESGTAESGFRQRWTSAFSVDSAQMPSTKQTAIIEFVATGTAGNEIRDRLTVSAMRQQSVQIIPRTISVLDASPGTTVTKSLTCLFSDEDHAVDLSQIQIDHDLPIPVRLDWEPGQSATRRQGHLTLGPLPTSESSLRGTIRLNFNSPDLKEPVSLSIVISLRSIVQRR